MGMGYNIYLAVGTGGREEALRWWVQASLEGDERVLGLSSPDADGSDRDQSTRTSSVGMADEGSAFQSTSNE